MPKSICLFFGLMFLSGLNIVAQEFNFGLLAGFDIVNPHRINKSDIIDTRYSYPMLSFNVNGYIGFKGAGISGLTIEPGFIRKGGFTVWHKAINPDADFRIHLNYVQVPVSAVFYIQKKFFLSLGPEFTWLINAKSTSNQIQIDLVDVVYKNNFELSGLIGLNYSITPKMDIVLRYNHGLTYTYKLETMKEYNQYFQLNIRFKFKSPR